MGKKQPKKQKVGRVRESKQNENENENETESEDGEDGAHGGGQHDDAAQDAALIKKMMDQYVPDKGKGLSKEETEALHKLGKEAYQAHKEMGKEEDEAFKHAGEAMKLAHHMSTKTQKEDESEESEDGEGDQPAPKKGKKPAPKADDAHDDDDDGDASESEGEENETESEGEENETESEGEENETESEGEGKKESKRVRQLTKRLLETEGRLAALEAKERKQDLKRYVETKLKESKQPVSVTKKFREAAGTIKSKSDFDSKWKMFLEGVKNSPERDDDDFGVMMERSMSSNEDGERTSVNSDAADFSDCAE